jgi:hypothetical protein
MEMQVHEEFMRVPRSALPHLGKVTLGRTPLNDILKNVLNTNPLDQMSARKERWKGFGIPE